MVMLAVVGSMMRLTVRLIGSQRVRAMTAGTVDVRPGGLWQCTLPDSFAYVGQHCVGPVDLIAGLAGPG
jgi:hypothetical protein